MAFLSNFSNVFIDSDLDLDLDLGLSEESGDLGDKHYNDTTFDYESIFWNLDVLSRTTKRTERYILYILASFGTFMNLFVLFISMGSETLKSNRTTHLILSLSMADLLVCAGVMPLTPYMRELKIATAKESKHVWLVCSAWYFFTTLTCASSSLNICAIAIDRYIFITDPLHYEQKMTKRKMLMLLLTVWLLSSSISFITFLFNPFEISKMSSTLAPYNASNSSGGGGWERPCRLDPRPDYAVAVVVLVVLLPTIVIVILYAEIYRVVRSHRRSMRLQHAPRIKKERRQQTHTEETETTVTENSAVSGIESSADARSSSGSGGKFSEELKRRSMSFRTSFKEELLSPLAQKDRKAFLVLCVVEGTYMACWIPFAVVTILEIILQRSFANSLREILLWLGYSNSCWNPVIYGGLNQMFRAAVIRRCRRIRRHSLVSSDIRAASSYRSSLQSHSLQQDVYQLREQERKTSTDLNISDTM